MVKTVYRDCLIFLLLCILMADLGPEIVGDLVQRFNF